MPGDVTFEALLTAAGVAVAGGIVTAFVELVKAVFTTAGRTINGALAAFLASAVLYAIAIPATGAGTFNELLTVFLAWLATATSAVGIHSTVRTVRGG